MYFYVPFLQIIDRDFVQNHKHPIIMGMVVKVGLSDLFFVELGPCLARYFEDFLDFGLEFFV
jgi:hypothetical protein